MATQLRTRLANWLGKSQEKAITQSAQGPLVYLENAYAQVQARSVRQTSQYGYIDNINVFRAVNILADECGAIGWDVFVGKGKNKVKQDEGHPLVRLLQKPNPDQAGATFMQRLVAHWVIAGSVYQFAAFAGQGNGNAPNIYPRAGTQPVGLYVLHPMQVEPQVPNGILTGYRYQVGPYYVDYPTWKILPMRFFHPLDELAGVSPITVAALVIERQNEGEAWNFSLMKHAARPSGAFIAQNRLGEVSYGELKAEVKRIWAQGKQSVGYPLVLDNGLTYTQLGLSPLDVDWNVSDANAGRKIATAIGVDPLLLNDKEHSTYNNVREARLACIELTIIPIMDRIKDEWNGWLCPFYGDDVSVDYDKSTIEILRGNRSLFSTMVIQEWNTGLRSFNESTAELKLAKVDDMDDFYKFAPMLFVRRKNIPAWLDAQEASRQPAPVAALDEQKPLIQLGKNPPDSNTPPPNGNKPAPDGKKPPRGDLVELNTKADGVFHTLLVGPSQSATKATLSESDKAYYRQVNKERDTWEARMSEHLAQFFAEESALITAQTTGVASVGAAQTVVMAAVDAHTNALPHVLVPYYLDIAEAAKNRVVGLLGLKTAISIHRKDALSDLANYASSHIAGISDTTKARLRDTFTQAQTEEWSVDELFDVVASQYNNFSHDRALTIARTETLAASNLGGQIAMRQTGLPILKTWLATPDGLTRDWHELASGQQVPLNTPYEVNGEALLFPGDTSMGASAPNVVNCRCCETYAIDYARLPEETKELLLTHHKFNPYHSAATGQFASGSGVAMAPFAANAHMGNFSEEAQAAIQGRMKALGVSQEEGIKNCDAILAASIASGHEADAGWYERAAMMNNAVAKKYGVAREQAAGVIAATSPQVAWNAINQQTGQMHYDNVRNATYIIRTLKKDPAITIDASLLSTFEKYGASQVPAMREAYSGLAALSGETKKLSALSAMQVALLLSPVVTAYTANVAKSVKIMRGENPPDVLGGAKVRSFYANLLWTDSAGAVTVDTWMVRAVTGKSTISPQEAGKYLHSPTSNGLKGVGSYPFFAEIISKVAASHNMLPHEAQAAIWAQYRRTEGMADLRDT